MNKLLKKIIYCFIFIFISFVLLPLQSKATLLGYDDWNREDVYRPYPVLFLHGFASGDAQTWKEKKGVVVNADRRLLKYFEHYYQGPIALPKIDDIEEHERTRYPYLEIISFIDHWDGSTQELVDRNSSVDTFQSSDYYVQKGYRANGDAGWADKLDDAIELLVNAYQSDKIIFVSHSMGGLAAREFLTNSKYTPYNEDIEKLVTIDTPHLGSPLASLANGLTKTQKIGWFIPGLGWLFSIGVEVLDTAVALNSQIDIDGDAVNDMDITSSGSGFLDDLNSRPHPLGVDFYVIYSKAHEFSNWVMFGDYEGGDGVVSLDSQRGINKEGVRIFELADEVELTASHGYAPKVASDTDNILKFIDTTVPEVQITSPTPAEVFHATSITVEGTIDNEYLPADCKFTISVMRDQDGVEVFSKTYENRVRPFEYSDPVPAGFSEENISIEASKAKLVSGTYTISVTVENPAGIISNTAEVNIALSLEPPIITDERPTGALADTTPTIQARIYSPEDVDIDLASVQIVLDGSTVTHSVEPETGGPDIAISYTPTLDLTKDNPSTPENEGLHTVIINVLDVSGLQAEQKEWGFSIRDAPWPMFHCDTKHTGRSPYRGTQTSSLKWRCQTGSYVYSSPAISPDGTVYILSEDSYVGYLYAINPDGTPKWCYQTGYGVYSSPAIASDGTIYVGVYDYLYAINPDGTLKWCYQTGGNVTSPTIASDGTVYVGSDEYLYAINSDGTLKWRSEVGNMTISETSSPAISPDGTVYILSEDSYVGYLYAINPDGTFKWRCYVGDSYYSSPAIASDGTIYVSSWDRIISVHFCGYLYAINPDGTLKWIYKSDRWSSCFDSSPAIASDGTIYVGSEDNCLYAINPDGTLKWRYQTGGDVDSSPAIASDGTIYVGSDDDYIYAINPDGTLKWRYQTEFDIKSSPAISFDGTLYIVSRDDGYLYAIGE